MKSDWMKPVVQPYTGKQIPAFLHGVITPMFTPTDAQGEIDEPGVRAWTDYLINTGAVTTLFPRCGLGRMYDFSYDDVKQLTDIVIDHAGDRIPVMPGTMGEWHNNVAQRPEAAVFTRQSIELSQNAQKKGAVAIVLVLPTAIAADPGEVLEDVIFDYFKAVANEIDMPIVIYQPPGLDPNYQMTPSLLTRLLTLPNIAGMKFSSGEIVRLGRLAMVAEGSNFAFIAGDELAFLYAMTIGASGVIGQGCGLNPETLRAVYDRMMVRDIEGARDAQFDSVRAIDVAEGLDIPIAGLSYAQRKGVKVQPFTKMTEKPLYGDTAGSPIPEETMDRVERGLDELRARYPVS
jgi:4-hydroxy-tetrahydrodipicolinate synthase